MRELVELEFWNDTIEKSTQKQFLSSKNSYCLEKIKTMKIHIQEQSHALNATQSKIKKFQSIPWILFPSKNNKTNKNQLQSIKNTKYHIEIPKKKIATYTHTHN